MLQVTLLYHSSPLIQNSDLDEQSKQIVSAYVLKPANMDLASYSYVATNETHPVVQVEFSVGAHARSH